MYSSRLNGMIFYSYRNTKASLNTGFPEIFLMIAGFSEEKFAIPGFPESPYPPPLIFNAYAIGDVGSLRLTFLCT